MGKKNPDTGNSEHADTADPGEPRTLRTRTHTHWDSKRSDRGKSNTDDTEPGNIDTGDMGRKEHSDIGDNEHLNTKTSKHLGNS